MPAMVPECNEMFHGRHGSANRRAILHHLPHAHLDVRLRAVKIPWKCLKWAGGIVASAITMVGIDVLRFGDIVYLSLLERDAVRARMVLVCKPNA
jgi:hypothetical protein